MITRLFAFFLCLGLLLGDLPAFAAGLARLTELKGDVQVMPKGGAWHPAAENEELAAGDAVKTGAQSSATVVRKDGTELELMAFAQLAIEDENGFFLSAGRAWSHFVKSMGLPFYIRTPNATALIRGTTLGVEFEAERSRVVVYEGLVEVQGRDGRRENVAGGFRLDVDRAGRLERLERADARELDEGRGFRARRGLEERSERGMLAPGRQGDRRERDKGERRERGGEDKRGREEPRRALELRPGLEGKEGLERRMERIERKLGDRMIQREEKMRDRRQEAIDSLKRQLERNERQEREEERENGRLRDLLPGVLP